MVGNIKLPELSFCMKVKFMQQSSKAIPIWPASNTITTSSFSCRLRSSFPYSIMAMALKDGQLSAWMYQMDASECSPAHAMWASI
eukprot:1140519-Pelagomonas_calceolata.AAC.5